MFKANLDLCADSILAIISSSKEIMRHASSMSALVERFHASQERMQSANNNDSTTNVS